MSVLVLTVTTPDNTTNSALTAGSFDDAIKDFVNHVYRTVGGASRPVVTGFTVT